MTARGNLFERQLVFGVMAGALLTAASAFGGLRGVPGESNELDPPTARDLRGHSQERGEDGIPVHFEGVRQFDPPLPCEDLGYPYDFVMNRMLCFLANNDTPVAFQVELTAVGLAGCYVDDPGGDIGATWWVTEPVCLNENGDDTGADPAVDDCNEPNVWRSLLVTDPAQAGLLTWPEQPIFIADCEVIPIATYSMQTTEDPFGGPLSGPLVRETQPEPGTKCWGDSVGEWDGAQWTPPNLIVSMDDVMASSCCLNNDPDCMPHRTWVELDPQTPDMFFTLADYYETIRGFSGSPYPFSNPLGCPDPACLTSADCGDGLFCNGVERCLGGQCTPGFDPCPGQACDEINDVCYDCVNDADCDDGLFCNGAERCKGQQCVPGIDPCPGQGCDETALCGPGAMIKWTPVDATGPHLIADNEITLPGGQEATFEIHVAGWGGAAGNRELTVYEAAVDSAGYASGAGGPLNPLGWPGSPEDGAFVDWRPDFVFYDVGGDSGVLTATLDYRWVSLSFAGAPDGGGAYYAGTLILEVPADAAGTYAIDFAHDDRRTFMKDPVSERIVPLSHVAALLIIECPCNGDVDGDGVMSFDDILVTVQCARGNEPIPGVCGQADVDCNGIVNLCDADRVVCLFQEGLDCCGADVICGACVNDDVDLAPCTEATQDTCEDPPLAGEYLGDGTTCDCNENDILDVCDLDCTALAGDCQVPDCGESEDCNNNSVPDECDIEDGTSDDANQNGFPDECEARDPLAPGPPHDQAKNRFLTFVPNNADRPVAFQVELMAVGAPECYVNDPAGDVGMTWWLSEPQCYNGHNENPVDPALGCTARCYGGADHNTVCSSDLDCSTRLCNDNVWVSRLSPDPQPVRTWTEDMIYISDCEIIPVATYAVRAAHNPDDPDPLFSADLTVATIERPTEPAGSPKKWGDCVGAQSGGDYTPPDGEVNIDDIQAVTLFLRDHFNQPQWTWLELTREVPDLVVNQTDLQYIVLAFKHDAYPHSNPGNCP